MTADLELRAPKPYGNVTYADPKNGKYPIDTEEHIRAAWSYINMPKNAAKYPLNGVTLESVKSRIRAAMKRIGAHTDDDSHSAQRDPAWEQRRKRWANSLVGRQERRAMELARGNVEVRAKADGTGGTNFEFLGYGSTFYDEFPMWDKWNEPYDEDVWPGSFRQTLSRPDLDTPFLIGHNETGIPMARTRAGTMQLSEDDHGLYTRALLSGRRSDVRDLADAVERGDMDEMSIGFITRSQQWSEDWQKRHLTELDLHRGDVSVVALAANPNTRGASMTAFPTETLSRQAAAERQEQRANPVDQDMGDASDYDADGQVKCNNPKCAHQGEAMPAGSKFCSWCGDALVRLNDDGVPGVTEEDGAQAALAASSPDFETLSAWLEMEKMSA